METQRVSKARNGQMLKLKCRSRYSNEQLILFVGEGNFALSSCLATAFVAATNMVATSLDTRDELLKKYGNEAELNTWNLSRRGALVLHGFDACKMAMPEQRNRLSGFQSSFFHIINFNFPHAGFLGPESDPQMIKKHKKLVRLFFANARHMLRPGGQVHVSHKLGPPYDEWNLEEQARVSGLRLVELVPFHRKHYPGYQNRRGAGSRAGESFRLDQAATYIFAARTKEPPARTLNVCEPVGMRTTMTTPAQLKLAVRKAGASQVTSLQHVRADEVTGLEKLQLGKQKMKTLWTPKSGLQHMNLSNCQGPLGALAKDLGGTLEGEHAKIIEMDMASLNNSTNVKWNSQNIGCTESTLPPFSPQTKLKDMDAVSHVNPNQVLVFGRKETSKSHSTVLDSCVGQSQGSAGTTSTVDKIEEEIKEDCTSSKQKSPLLGIQLVAPLQRNVSCAAVDQHVKSAVIIGLDPVRMSSTMAHLKSLKQEAIRKARASQVTPLQELVADEVARPEKLKEEEKLGKKKMKTLETLKSALQQTNLETFQLVEASVEALAKDLRISLEEENEEIIDMDMAVSASLSSAADIEWGLQSSGCTKSLSSKTVDLAVQVNPGNEDLEKAEDRTKSDDILEPSPQFSKVSAETIFTVDKVEEDIEVDCQSPKQESPLLGIELMDDVAAFQRKNNLESSDLEESSSFNEESAGCLTVLSDLWEVMWGICKGSSKVRREERMKMVSNSTDIEWGSQGVVAV